MRNKLLIAAALAAGIGLGGCVTKNASGDADSNNNNRTRTEEVWSCKTDARLEIDFDQETCTVAGITLEDFTEEVHGENYTPATADPEPVTGLDSVRYRLFVEDFRYELMGSSLSGDATLMCGEEQCGGTIDLKYGEPVDLNELGSTRYNLPPRRATIEAVLRDQGGSLDVPVESVTEGPEDPNDPLALNGCTWVRTKYEVHDCVLFMIREYSSEPTQDSTPQD